MLSLLVKGREELKKWKERKRHYTENFFFFFFLFFFFLVKIYSGHNTEDHVLSSGIWSLLPFPGEN